MNDAQYLNNPHIFWGILFFGKKYQENIKLSIISTYLLGLLKVKGIGLIRALTILNFPILIWQFNPNFKIKFWLFGLPILSIRRKPISKEQAKNSFTFSHDRRDRKRIFLNISSLPFHDNKSGIPRVAKQIIKFKKYSLKYDIIPVYFHPVTGYLHEARSYELTLLHNNKHTIENDPIVAVKLGDILLNTMVISNELEFTKNIFFLLKQSGLIIGDILHDIIALNNPEYFRKRDIKLFKKWINYISFHDFIISVSKSSLTDYEEWCTKNKVCMPSSRQVIWLGSNFTKKNPIKPETIAINHPYALIVGTLEPRKGHDSIIKAFEILWENGIEYNLILVGRQGWKIRNLLNLIYNSKYFNHKLFWLNKISDCELSFLYQNASFCICPSRSEGFGLPLLEAAYYNKPIIARDIPVFHELNVSNVHYFSDDSPNSLSLLIYNFIEDLKLPSSTFNTTLNRNWSDFVSELSITISNINT